MSGVDQATASLLAARVLSGLMTAVTAVFHHLAPQATVVGVDHIPGLVDMARRNLAKDGVRVGAVSGAVDVVLGDGRLGQSCRSQRNTAEENKAHQNTVRSMSPHLSR